MFFFFSLSNLLQLFNWVVAFELYPLSLDRRVEGSYFNLSKYAGPDVSRCAIVCKGVELLFDGDQAQEPAGNRAAI